MASKDDTRTRYAPRPAPDPPPADKLTAKSLLAMTEAITGHPVPGWLADQIRDMPDMPTDMTADAARAMVVPFHRAAGSTAAGKSMHAGGIAWDLAPGGLDLGAIEFPATAARAPGGSDGEGDDGRA
jgi:hypothetical protein